MNADFLCNEATAFREIIKKGPVLYRDYLHKHKH